MFIKPKRYPTDVSNTQWIFIEKLLSEEVPSSQKGRKRTTDIRSVVNAINYRWKTGCTWRMLPHDFPKWETVYTYFKFWRDRGLLPQLREIMLMKKYPASANGECKTEYVHNNTYGYGEMLTHKSTSPDSHNQHCNWPDKNLIDTLDQNREFQSHHSNHEQENSTNQQYATSDLQ